METLKLALKPILDMLASKTFITQVVTAIMNVVIAFSPIVSKNAEIEAALRGFLMIVLWDVGKRLANKWAADDERQHELDKIEAEKPPASVRNIPA